MGETAEEREMDLAYNQTEMTSVNEWLQDFAQGMGPDGERRSKYLANANTKKEGIGDLVEADLDSINAKLKEFQEAFKATPDPRRAENHYKRTALTYVLNAIDACKKTTPYTDYLNVVTLLVEEEIPR